MYKRQLPPLADRKIEPEDRLIIRVTRADLFRLQQEHTIFLGENKTSFDGANVFSDDEGTKTFEALLPAGSTLAGASLRELRFRQRHNATVLAIKKRSTNCSGETRPSCFKGWRCFIIASTFRFNKRFAS